MAGWKKLCRFAWVAVMFVVKVCKILQHTGWCMHIWLGAKLWPQKDIFHGHEKVLDPMKGMLHELHAMFANGLPNAALRYEEQSKIEATK